MEKERKKKIKKLFIQYGAKPSFFDKPAVAERIYEDFKDKNIKELIKALEDGSISISTNGDIYYNNIEIIADGKEEEIHLPSTRDHSIMREKEYVFYIEIDESVGEKHRIYTIDKYGMDSSFESLPSLMTGLFGDSDEVIYTRRPFSFSIEYYSGSDGDGTDEFVDTGDWKITKQDSNLKDNMKWLLKEYPITRNWFAQRLPLAKEISLAKKAYMGIRIIGSKLNGKHVKVKKCLKDNPETRTEKHGNVEKCLKDYPETRTEKHGNVEKCLKDYPETGHWYVAKIPMDARIKINKAIEKHVKSTEIEFSKQALTSIKNNTVIEKHIGSTEIEASRRALARMSQNIQTLRKEKEKLEKQNEELVKKNNSLTKMLDKSLNVLEEIHKSPFGKIFFGGKINKFEESKRIIETER